MEFRLQSRSGCQVGGRKDGTTTKSTGPKGQSTFRLDRSRFDRNSVSGMSVVGWDGVEMVAMFESGEFFVFFL